MLTKRLVRMEVATIVTAITVLVSIVWFFAAMDKRIAVLENEHARFANQIEDFENQISSESRIQEEEQARFRQSIEEKVEKIYFFLFAKNQQNKTQASLS